MLIIIEPVDLQAYVTPKTVALNYVGNSSRDCTMSTGSMKLQKLFVMTTHIVT